MQTHFLFDLLRGYEPFEQMVAESQKPGAVIAASGLYGAQKTHLACALAAQTGRPLCLVTPGEAEATRFAADLNPLGVAAADGLRMRSGPGTDFSRVATVPTGTQVTALGADGTDGWILVQYNGSYGWLTKQYLTAN